MKHLVSRQEYEELVKTFPGEYCPFCDGAEQIRLGESKYWTWIASISPYWKFHTMLIPKRHIDSISELSVEEFVDMQTFYKKIVEHLLILQIKQTDGSLVDQFILMIRTRCDADESTATYYKPRHLHIHLVPDKEGVDRFILDPEAINVDVKSLAMTGANAPTPCQ